MSPQIIHALKQAGIMILLAAVAALINQQTDLLNAIVGPTYSVLLLPIIGAALGSFVRYLEGIRDGDRAAIGQMVPADVGYQAAVDLASSTVPPPAMMGPNGEVYVG